LNGLEKKLLAVLPTSLAAGVGGVFDLAAGVELWFFLLFGGGGAIVSWRN
jgi:hypothetical protein